ncbi:MAG: hypothetical protein V1676_06915 [Candidatus Diapherotrites archaeon]
MGALAGFGKGQGRVYSPFLNAFLNLCLPFIYEKPAFKKGLKTRQAEKAGKRGGMKGGCYFYAV